MSFETYSMNFVTFLVRVFDWFCFLCFGGCQWKYTISVFTLNGCNYSHSAIKNTFLPL